MGNSRSGPSHGSLPSDRNLHVTYLSYQRVHGTIKDFVVFKFQVGTGRYVWPLHKRYSEVHALDAVLIEKYSSAMSSMLFSSNPAALYAWTAFTFSPASRKRSAASLCNPSSANIWAILTHIEPILTHKII